MVFWFFFLEARREVRQGSCWTTERVNHRHLERSTALSLSALGTERIASKLSIVTAIKGAFREEVKCDATRLVCAVLDIKTEEEPTAEASLFILCSRSNPRKIVLLGAATSS